jgi:putative aldouronate transport system substrate-binding protein
MKNTWVKMTILLLLAAFLLSACTTTPTTTATTKATTTAAPTGTTATPTTTVWGDPNLNPPGELPICKETVKLTVGVRQQANVVDFETNDMTTSLEEDGNFDLTFQYYTSEMVTQINLIVAGGDFGSLPDIMMIAPGDAYVYQWGQAGALTVLNEFYEKSAFHAIEAIDRTGVDFMPMITSPDGSIYGIPTYNQSVNNEYPGRIYINKPWLDTLDLPLPKTTEEFYNVLKAFLTEDPNGNGQADEIPMLSEPFGPTASWMLALVNPFDYMTTSPYRVDDGVISVWYNTDGYREALQYISKLVSENLIPDYQFTIDTTSYKNLAGNAEIPIVGVVTGLSAIDTGRVGDYPGIPPLSQPDGTQYTAFSPSSANVGMMISSACETPEAAFRLGDLLVSERYSIMTRWGNEGQHWDFVQNAKTDISKMDAPYTSSGFPGYLIVYEDPWGIVQNFHWQQQGPFIRQYGIAAGRLVAPGQVNEASMNAQIMPSYIEVGKATSIERTVRKLIYTSIETMAINERQSTISSYVSEQTAMFLTGRLDINNDTSWNDYVKQLDAIGLQDVRQIVQNVYDRMYK